MFHNTNDDLLVISLTQEIQGNNQTIQLLPFGWVTTDKGTFLVDEQAMTEITNSFNAKVNDLVVDYEHQTLKDEAAPAAGWINKLENRLQNGLWANTQWTSKARQYITNREYRYISPVILVRKSDQRAVRLHSAGLTNTPAIDGMVPLAAKNDLGFGVILDPLQIQVNKLLGLSAEDFLKHNPGSDELSLKQEEIGSNLIDPAQRQINKLLGLSEEVFSKYDK